jgi:uncharacterized protein YceH (UPF0502 family)
LPREPRRKDHAWAHLFSGPIESAPASADVPEREAPRTRADATTTTLEARVTRLEQEIAAIKESLGL